MYMHTHVYAMLCVWKSEDLLEWFTDGGPPSPTTVYQWKVQESIVVQSTRLYVLAGLQDILESRSRH